MSTSEASPADDEVAGSTGPDPEAGGGACSTPPRCSPSRASPPPPSPAYSPTSTSPSWREHLKRCPEAHGTERLASSSHFKFASVSPCKSVTLRQRVMTVRMLSGMGGGGRGGVGGGGLWHSSLSSVFFTSAQTVYGLLGTTTSTFTQLLSSDESESSVLLYVHRDHKDC